MEACALAITIVRKLWLFRDGVQLIPRLEAHLSVDSGDNSLLLESALVWQIIAENLLFRLFMKDT